MSIGNNPENMTIMQLKAMLLGKGSSFPIDSPYARILGVLEDRDLITKNEHNQYFYRPLPPVLETTDISEVINPQPDFIPYAPKKGDKVHLFNPNRKAFMQTVYIVCKPIVRDDTTWYPIVTDYRKGMLYRKSSELKAVS